MVAGFTLTSTKLRIRNSWVRDALSEILSTFTLCIFVYGSAAQDVLTYGAKSSMEGRALASGCGLTLAVYVGFNASGACVNPTISLAFCLLGMVKWKKYLWYVLFELVGAFLAAATVYGVYYGALEEFDGGVRQVYGTNATAHIFASYPREGLSKINGYFDVVVGNALLVGLTLAIIDPNNAKAHTGVQPIPLAFVVYGIVMAFGHNTGAPINPAMDFGARLFTAAAGWGDDVFVRGDYWFWVPIAGTFSGSLFVTFLYQLCIGINVKAKVEDESNWDLQGLSFKPSGDVAMSDIESGIVVGSTNSVNGFLT